jgi:small subunit ribosomal protein S1
MDFGIFVTLEDGIDGLVHTSDIAWEDTKGALKTYKNGDMVEFKILEFNKNEMRISCGIKQLTKSPWQLLNEKYQPKMKVQGVVSGITKFGIFIKLEEKVEGMVHISEISKTRIENIEEIFKIGDSVEAIVLNVDVKKKKISLSMKQFNIQSEKEEINKHTDEVKPSAFTIGDMINLKKGE